MDRKIETFDSRIKAVDAVADWIAARVRTDAAGVQSLAHVLAVVPTAQSGRRLRLALARRFQSGVVPPLVRTPAHLIDLSAPDIARQTSPDARTNFSRFARRSATRSDSTSPRSFPTFAVFSAPARFPSPTSRSALAESSPGTSLTWRPNAGMASPRLRDATWPRSQDAEGAMPFSR